MDPSLFCQGAMNLIHFRNPTRNWPFSWESGGMQILKMLYHKPFKLEGALMSPMLTLLTDFPAHSTIALLMVSPFNFSLQTYQVAHSSSKLIRMYRLHLASWIFLIHIHHPLKSIFLVISKAPQISKCFLTPQTTFFYYFPKNLKLELL